MRRARHCSIRQPVTVGFLRSVSRMFWKGGQSAAVGGLSNLRTIRLSETDTQPL